MRGVGAGGCAFMTSSRWLLSSASPSTARSTASDSCTSPGAAGHSGAPGRCSSASAPPRYSPQPSTAQTIYSADVWHPRTCAREM